MLMQKAMAIALMATLFHPVAYGTAPEQKDSSR